MVSDAITEEVVLSDRVKRLALSEEIWIEAILRATDDNADRHMYYKRIRNKGFDIFDQVRKLEELYMKC